LFPLDVSGLGRSLLASRRAALTAHDAAIASGVLAPVVRPELDIVCFAPIKAAERPRASRITQRSEAIFVHCERDAQPIFLAKWRLPKAFGQRTALPVEWDADHCTVLRSVMMKPEHEDIAGSMVRRIAAHFPR
jgi:tyrosine decarboxylase/aspartate 1-decarboxylase